jgi:hypothetical protein
LPRDAAVRRFTTVWAVSLAVKLVALGLFVVLVAKFLGGF